MVAVVVTLVAAKPTTEDIDINKSETSDELLKSAHELLKRIDAEYAKWNNIQSITAWNYASNLTNENLAEKLKCSAEGANVTKHIIQIVNDFPWRDLKNESMKRQFKKLSILGVAALPEQVNIYWIGQKVFSYFLIQNCIYDIFVKNEQNLNLKRGFKTWNFYFRKVTIFFEFL